MYVTQISASGQVSLAATSPRLWRRRGPSRRSPAGGGRKRCRGSCWNGGVGRGLELSSGPGSGHYKEHSPSWWASSSGPPRTSSSIPTTTGSSACCSAGWSGWVSVLAIFRYKIILFRLGLCSQFLLANTAAWLGAPRLLNRHAYLASYLTGFTVMTGFWLLLYLLWSPLLGLPYPPPLLGAQASSLLARPTS